jgi:energy-coupling factor transporter transmembrane protein EcfT
MNRTQKIVLCNLVIVLLTLAMLAYVLFQFFVLKKIPEGFTGRFLPPALLILLGGSLLVWALRRQSSREVETDERDKLIANKAAMVFLVSAWIVFPAISVIPRFILGDDGCIPAWSLPLINVGALIIIMMVYSIAVLVQYISGRNNGSK